MSVAQEMLETHPTQGYVEPEKLAACIRDCFDCAQACITCMDACLSEPEIQSLLHCIRLNSNCADICEATGRVLARPADLEWGMLYSQLQTCIVICQACAAECERHRHHDHCRICALACRQCEESCLELFGMLPRS